MIYQKQNNMTKLLNKQDVQSKLTSFGIEICNSRTVGYNSFSLIYETYGHFVVNAKAGTDYKIVREFGSTFSNITILINN